MGKPTAAANKQKNRTRDVEIKAKRKTPSGSHLGRPNHFKGEFQKHIGNAKTGRGYNLVQKKRILSRFRRKLKRRNKGNENDHSRESFYINSQVEQKESEESSREDTLARPKDSSLHGSTFSLFRRKNNKKKETNAKRVEIDYNALQDERKKKAEEIQANIKEHEDMVTKNLYKRKQVTKQLSQRTKRGQPVMANRLEMMLEKIKKN